MAASQGVGSNSAGSGCGGGGNGGGTAGGGSSAGAGGGGGGTLVLPIPVPTLFGQPFPNGPQWNPGGLQPQHTARSLDRALEEAGNSGILSLSGRKLREFPGSGYDLTDTTQAGDRTRLWGGEERAKNEEVGRGGGCVSALLDCWSGRVQPGVELTKSEPLVNVGGREGNRGGGKGMLIGRCMEIGWDVRAERTLLLKRVFPVRGGEGGIDTFHNALPPTLLDALIFSGGRGWGWKQYIKP